jgi:putative sigma-54 modulation protein
VRIDVEPDVRSRTPRFTAKGRVEVAGPDLTASVTTDAAPAAITLLIEKLDRMLRRRTSNLLRRRSTGDIRAHAGPLLLA